MKFINYKLIVYSRRTPFSFRNTAWVFGYLLQGDYAVCQKWNGGGWKQVDERPPGTVADAETLPGTPGKDKSYHADYSNSIGYLYLTAYGWNRLQRNLTATPSV